MQKLLKICPPQLEIRKREAILPVGVGMHTELVKCCSFDKLTPYSRVLSGSWLPPPPRTSKTQNPSLEYEPSSELLHISAHTSRATLPVSRHPLL